MTHGNRYSGGRVVLDSGYIGILMPDHPRAANRYVREHILVVERALGHALPSRAPIHHVDEDRANNANGNLVVCESRAYHMLLHRRQRALDACGDANAHKCEICHGYQDQGDIVTAVRPNGDHRAYHKKCNAKRSAARYGGMAS